MKHNVFRLPKHVARPTIRCSMQHPKWCKTLVYLALEFPGTVASPVKSLKAFNGVLSISLLIKLLYYLNIFVLCLEEIQVNAIAKHHLTFDPMPCIFNMSILISSHVLRHKGKVTIIKDRDSWNQNIGWNFKPNCMKFYLISHI